MHEISVTDIGPVCIGQTENTEAATGCTVFIAPEGMRAGLDVRGGGPAGRESQLLNPLMAARQIHAIVWPAAAPTVWARRSGRCSRGIQGSHTSATE